MQFDHIDAAILNTYQKGLELTTRPFLKLSKELNITEELIIERIQGYKDSRVISRFGPMYDVVRSGGAFLLCAIEVPLERFEEVTQMLNDVPEVAHNYKREHRFNMWFVLAVEEKEQIDKACKDIEELTGLKVFGFDKEVEYLVNLFLPVEATDV